MLYLFPLPSLTLVCHIMSAPLYPNNCKHWLCGTLEKWKPKDANHMSFVVFQVKAQILYVPLCNEMRCSRACCGTPPIWGVVKVVGTRTFTCYMGAL